MTSNEKPGVSPPSGEPTPYAGPPTSHTAMQASAKAKKSPRTIFWTAALGTMALILTLFLVWVAQPAIEYGLWWVVAFLLIGAAGLWAGVFQSWVTHD